MSALKETQPCESEGVSNTTHFWGLNPGCGGGFVYSTCTRVCGVYVCVCICLYLYADVRSVCMYVCGRVCVCICISECTFVTPTLRRIKRGAEASLSRVLKFVCLHIVNILLLSLLPRVAIAVLPFSLFLLLLPFLSVVCLCCLFFFF